MNSIRTASASLLICLSPAAAVGQSSGHELTAAFQAVPEEADGRFDFARGASWAPLLAVDWDAPSATTEAWLRTHWSRRGLHLSLVLPNADASARGNAGRAPPAPFQVGIEIEGGAGDYRIRCIPLTEPVSRMTRRLHAYLFNHRLGASAREGEAGHVLCHEVSLLGILADSLETRWTERPDGGVQLEALVPWRTLRLPAPAPGAALPMAVEVSRPGVPPVRWGTGRVRLAGERPTRGDGAAREANEVAGVEAGRLLVRAPYVRQGEPIAAVYVPADPLAGAGTDPVLTFELVDEVARVRARVEATVEATADATFARLPTGDLPDGRMTVRARRGDRVLAETAVRLVGDEIEASIERESEKLSARADRMADAGLSAMLQGHLARARRMLELARLPERLDSTALSTSSTLLADAAAVLAALESGRRPEAAYEGFAHGAGFAADGVRGPITFEPVEGHAARLTVHADRPVDWALTPRVYGTFSEPVVYDRPIYSLLYAQQLRNPSFEFGHPTAEATVAAFVGYDELEPVGAEAALTGRWLPRVPAGVEEVAAPWIGVGRGTVTFTIECVGYNDRQCQRVRAGSGARDAGVAQVIELPAWRTTGYRLRGFARSDDVSSIRAVLYHEGRVVDSVRLDGVQTGWRELTADLTAPKVIGPENAFLLAILFDGPGSVDLDLFTLYPDDAIDGFDPQALEQLRALNTGWVRWPGGNYASDYHWPDGVGPLDLRPSTPNPSWPGLNPNFVGTDEMLRLAERLGFEVMITVNAGSGTAEEAARWVEYVNGDTTTALGRLRARNGHPRPYGVRYWNIGNELWGHWQVGYTNPEEHARRYAAFARAMRAADPAIHIIANAHGGHSESPPEPWNRPLLERFADQLETLDIHTYVGVPDEPGLSPQERAFLLSTIPLSYEQWLMEFRADLVRRGLERLDVIVGEYNASIRSEPEEVERTAALLAYGAYLHTFVRQGEYVVGANATEYSPFDPRALPFGRMHPRYDLFRVYAEHAGTVPLEATLRTPVRQQPNRVGRDVLPIFNVPLVDAVALLDPEDGSVGVSLINRSMDDEVPVRIEIDGLTPGAEGRWFLFTQLGLRERAIDAGRAFTVTLPPGSVSLVKAYAGAR